MTRASAVGAAVVLLAGGSIGPSAFAQDAPGTRPDAGAADAAGGQTRPDTAPGSSAAPLATDPRPAQIRALIAGALDVTVDAGSLFAVSLSDDDAVQIEAVRVRTLLRALEEAATAAAATAAAATAAAPSAAPRLGKPAPDAAPDAGALRDDIGALDPVRWAAHVELERARLELYALPRARRAEILNAHAERQEAARPKETEEERRARDAEAERQRALEAARAARTEAERLVGEELARLISLQQEVQAARARWDQERENLRARRDTVLGWQRRARDVKATDVAGADATYDALRPALRASREDLSAALTDMEARPSDVPLLGRNPLVDVPPEVSTERVAERRTRLQAEIAEAQAEERTLRQERASSLLDEITVLNRERLALLPRLSSDKRGAITGFTAAGWEQARAEAFHLSLVLRYHQRLARGWVASLRTGGGSGIAPWGAAGVIVPWIFLAGVFTWGRRRSPGLLDLLRQRLTELDRTERRTSASPGLRGAHLLAKVHRPAEWLLFGAVTMWVLPPAVSDLLEVQLLSSVIGWVLGGALVVDVIHALAAGSGPAPVDGDSGVAAVRLRSLRLVGRTVVLFALILVVSARLVGEGTIYDWVLSTCWLAALPLFLVLVRWWRDTVFERIERARKKSRVEAWVLSNRTGWQSFLAAMVGALRLFFAGAVKTLRGWISGFDLARRGHAYLFRRELERLGEGREKTPLTPLGEEARAALHPDAPYTKWLPSPGEEMLERLLARVEAGRPGVVAIIGPLGMGKTSLLRALASRAPLSVRLDCRGTTSLDDVRRAAFPEPTSAAPPPAILLDDAHALVKPVIGGLSTFDRIVALARSPAGPATWVLAIDASVWPFLRRARDARPLFDETIELGPWNETQIGALLAERSALAGVTPTYDGLLDELPPGSDELDRLDALKEKEVGYVRMLWDHVRGNPALALEGWRASLATDPRGAVRVRPLQLPDASSLEALPDSSLFVLRAVLQLAPATVAGVARATRLSEEQVENALRFGQAVGFLHEDDGGVRVTWRWLRPITRLLERRHLLVNP